VTYCLVSHKWSYRRFASKVILTNKSLISHFFFQFINAFSLVDQGLEGLACLNLIIKFINELRILSLKEQTVPLKGLSLLLQGGKDPLLLVDDGSERADLDISDRLQIFNGTVHVTVEDSLLVLRLLQLITFNGCVEL